MPIYANLKRLKDMEKQYLETIKQHKIAIDYVKEQTEEMCLEGVKQNGIALKFVKEQTEEICLEAVKGHALSLRYVKEPTKEIYLEAVKQNGYNLGLIKEPTEEMCLIAVKQYGEIIKKVKNKTPELCFYAFLNDYSLLEFKYIKKGIDEFINNQSLKNIIFSLKEFENTNKSFYKLDIESFIYLKDYLLKQNNNKYILDDSIDVEILKDIALSNNELIIVDTESIINVHKKLANRIVKEEDLEKESF